ncbi:peptidase S1 and S6 chymotrypsin/Hap family protein [Nitzschia inconspicua]|uniref:Peptidase S1 and S6 chymotrypsin/Hap family protein n=1 Tax=Nitzschia inconspicua TaxID=303405 RepID=A0A9K3L2C3_9STRA|nr:peptidase S1 and S6 chymotrypsin/Hap family protein [Nitzschia inconspicua]
MKFRREFALLALCHAVPASTFVPLSLKARTTSLASPSEKYAFYSMTGDPSGPLLAENNEYNNNYDAIKNGQRDAFSNLSVTELKRILIDRGVDFRDCLEKRDLVERLRESEAMGYGSSYQQAHSPSSEGLLSEEVVLINTFKRVSPSVANIKTTTFVPAQDGLRLRPMEVPIGTGSGFLWDSKGHVVTNFHVVSAGRRDGRIPETVKVKLAGLVEARDADVVGVEPEKDLAVLRLRDRRNLPPPIPVGTSNDLQVGQSVLAIGNPFGLDDTLTKGIVSALGRDVDGIGGRPIHGCIQTDAAINQGNSGGPLMDSRGRLIGVNTAIFSPSGGNVGIGFAIPVDTVRRVVNQIINYGKVVRPTLGISIVDDRIVKAIEQQLGRQVEGCLVASVVPNSPAETSGLQASQLSGDGSVLLGDLVTEINGEPVRQAEDLISAVEEKDEGDVVTLRVLRKCDPRQAEYVRVRLTTRDKLDGQNRIGARAPWQ